MMIRTATTNDLSGIAELEQEWPESRHGATVHAVSLNYESYPAATPSSPLRTRRSSPSLRAPRTNDGSCIYTQGDRIIEVLDLFVTRNWRGKGVGQALLTAIEVQAKKDQYTKLIVYSSVRDIDGVLAFYRASGFTSWSMQLFKELGADVLSE